MRYFRPLKIELKVGNVYNLKLRYSAWGNHQETSITVRITDIKRTRVFFEKISGWYKRCPKYMTKDMFLSRCSIETSDTVLAIDDRFFDISAQLEKENAEVNKGIVSARAKYDKLLEEVKAHINVLSSEHTKIVAFRTRSFEDFISPLRQLTKLDILKKITRKVYDRAEHRQFIDKLTLPLSERFDALKQKLYESKTPANMDEHVGIELETIMPKDQVPALERALFKYRNIVEIKEDASISDKGSYEVGREFCLLIKKDEVNETVPKILAALNSVAIRVNNTCGLHVHLDARQSDHDQIATNLINRLDDIWQRCASHRKSNQYCEDNRQDRFSRGGRYKAINRDAFGKYGTIEVRTKEATLNAQEIVDYVQFLNTIKDETIVA